MSFEYKEEHDDIEKFVDEENANKLPLGWLCLYIGLIVWGIWYFYMYTPMFTGWTQAGELAESMKNLK